MSLPVISCCSYLTHVDATWRSQDYDAHDFVFAIKDRPINGYAYVPCRGTRRFLTNHNRDQALVWFGQIVSDIGDQYGLRAPAILVPVPNSRCHVSLAETPRTLNQALALANELGHGVEVSDVLRWARPMTAASTLGGTRDPRQLYEELVSISTPPCRAGVACVLVDDVLTSGGHLQACAAKLREGGCFVDLAVVAGRSGEQVDEAFSIRQDEIEDFIPDP